MIARLLVALCLGFAACAALVDKGERQLHLMRGGAVWNNYPICHRAADQNWSVSFSYF